MGANTAFRKLERAELPTSGAILKIPNVGPLKQWGPTVPSDGTAGYAPGCQFQDTTNGIMYINEGTAASCDFNRAISQTQLDSQFVSKLSAQFGAQFDTDFPPAGANAGRGPSTGIWSTCPVIDYMLDPTKGMVMFNDFHGGYTLAAKQASTYLGDGVQGFTGDTDDTISSVDTDPNGVLQLLTTTNNESAGISLLGSKNVAGQFVLTSGKKSWFEARIKTVNITDSKYGFFVGFAQEGLLAEDGVIGDDGALPDKDYIGFLRVEADGDKLDTVHRKAGGAGVVVKADAVTVVANTYIKIGFYCDGTTVTFYANGVALADTCLLATATVPTAEEMAFYAVLGAASDDEATLSLDWVRVAREF